MSTWRPIPGYEGYYEASDEGLIRSVSRVTNDGRRMKGRVLKTTVTSAGYLAFTASRDSVKRTVFVHQAVMLAHAGPRPEGMIVRHLDGDPRNNSLANLAWGTTTENALDSVAHGTHKWAAKTHCPHGHAYDDENTMLRTGSGGRMRRDCRACDRARSRRKNAVNVARRRAKRRAARSGAAA